LEGIQFCIDFRLDQTHKFIGIQSKCKRGTSLANDAIQLVHLVGARRLLQVLVLEVSQSHVYRIQQVLENEKNVQVIYLHAR
jgi:hypothetical protein